MKKESKVITFKPDQRVLALLIAFGYLNSRTYTVVPGRQLSPLINNTLLEKLTSVRAQYPKETTPEEIELRFQNDLLRNEIERITRKTESNARKIIELKLIREGRIDERD